LGRHRYGFTVPVSNPQRIATNFFF